MFTLNHKHELNYRLMKLTDPTLVRSPRLGWTGRVAIAAAAVALMPSLHPVELRAEDAAALKERITALEKRLAELEKSKSDEQRLEQLRAENRQNARKRAAEDRRHYQPEELREIETLYQVANTKGKRSDEAKQSLQKLLSKYDKANRTGCATLYLGQASEGKERLEYLTRAVEKFSDCYYFNGCQVGGYGRYVLALTLWETGEKEKAKQLLTEIRQKYKDAIDHAGRPMTELVDAAEKELGIAKG